MSLSDGFQVNKYTNIKDNNPQIDILIKGNKNLIINMILE